jgi:hypothetical protein
VGPDQIEKELHFRHPLFVGQRMPTPLFRDDFVNQENGFVDAGG